MKGICFLAVRPLLQRRTGIFKLYFDDNAPQSLLDLFTSYRSVK
jgi:hypothetical protein